MTSVTLYIPKIAWTVFVYAGVSCLDTEMVIQHLSVLGGSSDYLERAFDVINSCSPNVGFTYSDLEDRESIIVIGVTTSAAEFLSTLTHELHHLVNDIAIAGKISDKEAAGYLMGEMSKSLYPHLHQYLCDECRRKRMN